MPSKKTLYPTPTEFLPPSFFRSVSDKDPQTLSWDEIFAKITKDSRITKNTKTARALMQKGDKVNYGRQKAYSGAITPAAQCQGGHNRDNIVCLTGVSMVDLDHIPSDRMADITAKVKADPHTFLAHMTCSGEGLRIFFKYTSNDEQIPYIDAWAWGNEYYAMVAGFDYDRATKDPSRLSYLSHDADALFNPDAVPFRIVACDKDPLDYSSTSHLDRIGRAVDILSRQGESCNEGSRHNYLLKLARLLVKYGVSLSEAQEYAEGVMPDDPQDARSAMAWVYEHNADQLGSWLVDKQSGKRVVIDEDGNESPKQRDRGSDTPRNATPEEIKQYLLSHETMRYNTVSAVTELFSPAMQKFVDIDDRVSNTIWHECCLALGKYVRPTDFDKELHSEAVPAYNPIEQYFAALPEWDGQDHIGMMAARVHTSTEPHIFDLCFRKWLVAMVASWLDPKVTNQNILTFIGDQGIFKSTFFRRLLPPELNRYFLAKGNSTYVSKDDKLAVSSHLLIDFEEIDSMKDADLNAVKALVTTEVISERAAYARNRENRVHLASFCATGNNRSFLTDLTGNRRWLPFEVESIDSPYDHPIDHQQLYAQALRLVRSGYQYWFTHDEDLALEAHKNTFTEPCLEEEQLQRYYRRPERMEAGLFLTTTEIVARCSADLRGMLSTKKMGQALKKLGFRQRGTNGRRGYILVERTYEEISQGRIQTATEVMRQEREKRMAQQLTLESVQEAEAESRGDSL